MSANLGVSPPRLSANMVAMYVEVIVELFMEDNCTVTFGAVAPGIALFPQKRGPPPWKTR